MPERIEMQSHLTSLVPIVRRRDMDRYLAIRLSPRKKQSALMALAAFHCELCHIPHAASEPGLAAIRFHWWREALRSMEEGDRDRTGNPVADSLMAILDMHHLPVELTHEMIDAHESFGTEQRSGDRDLQNLETQWRALSAPIYQLSAQVLGGGQEANLTLATDAAAIACAASRNTLLDPIILRESAEKHRAKCAQALMNLPAEIFPAFLPVSLTGLNLEILEQPGRKDAHPLVEENPGQRLRRLWTIWRAYRKTRLD